MLQDNFSAMDREIVQHAFQFALSAHKGQVRVSGEPQINHCLSVAIILAELRAQTAVIVAGLLHDTIEDTSTTLDDIKNEFGEEVAKLVDGVTKLANLPQISGYDFSKDELQKEIDTTPDKSISISTKPGAKNRKADLRQENLRKTLMAMSEDIRVILIKLADRLHNMRTLGYLPEPKRKKIAQETLDIWAPLANRLGIWRIKWELEDLAFRYVNPEKFKEIAENLSDRRAQREDQINKIIDRLKGLMKQAGISADISGRPKHIYSIYRKMVDKGKPFEMVRDLRAVRLIVPSIEDCYASLGVIHTNWRPIPHEFDDYIAAPKDNYYQSLHTAVIYDDGKPLEVQIRTNEMNNNAEFGIAAHWRYKEKTKNYDAYEQRINWLRRVMEWRTDIQDAQEFVEGVKTDVFQDQVYIFTPRGDIINLPSGSTPIDFAYHVHTEIGHRCRGAKVNGKLVGLDYTLKTGDQVVILTAKQGGPSRDWLNPSLGLVKTQRSRSKIQQWFKRQDREQNLSQGKLILDREMRRLGIENTDRNELTRSFDLHSEDELYVAIGTGDISPLRIVNRLLELNKQEIDPLLTPKGHLTQPKPGDVTVLGLRDILTSFARCCNPAPGDDIVGYITRGRGATIHRQDCPNILRLRDRERIVKVSWGEAHQTYPVAIEIKAYDRQGLMNDVSTILSQESVNLIDINLKVNQSFASITLVLEVNDISQLSRLLTRIENLPNILEAHRVKPG